MSTKPYGAAAMQDVTEEMSASTLTCISNSQQTDGWYMDDIKGRTLTTDSHESLVDLA